MNRHERYLLACALMRKLWQKWDSGGESMRSVRSRLLESVLWLAPADLPAVDPHFEFFEELKGLGIPDTPRPRPVPCRLDHLPVEFLTSVAMYRVSSMVTEEHSCYEQWLVQAITLLLGTTDAEELLRLHGPFGAETMIREGHYRSSTIDCFSITGGL